MAAHSFWLKTKRAPSFKPLEENRKTDVLIVGAGLAGLMAARELAGRGRGVLVLDAGLPGEGDTGHTSAHLTSLLDVPWAELIELHGLTAARHVFAAHEEAIDILEKTAASGPEGCDFARVPGYLVSRPDEAGSSAEEHRALGRLGYGHAQLLDGMPQNTALEGPALLMPGQGRIHALKLLRAAASRASRAGARIYAHSPVREIGGRHVVTAAGHRVEANDIIIATHMPIAAPLFFLKDMPWTTYAAGFRVPCGELKDALYWDTENPYHYVRIQPLDGDSDLLIAGGEDHPTGRPEREDEEAHAGALEAWVRQTFPCAGEVLARWSGQVIEPADGLAYIGRIPYRKNLFMASGFSGNGWTWSVIAGRVLASLLCGEHHPLIDILDPSRKKTRSLFSFLKENLEAAGEAVASRVRRGDGGIGEEEDLAPGQGGVFSRGLQKTACFRAENGDLHRFSAVCTHLKGIVQWNALEKTFDCPCHGSRFDTEGCPVSGPAREPLSRLDTKMRTLRKAG